MFIAYEKKRKPSKKVYSSGLLWGSGLTKNSALKDAKRWVKEYNKRHSEKDRTPVESLLVARVLKADKDLYKVLNEEGGSVSFTVRKGRVVSVRSRWGI